MRVPRDFVKLRRGLLTAVSLVSLSGLACPAVAQEITGTPGSPSATTTIDGKYLPNPPPAFGGEINLSAKDFEALLAAADRASQRRTERPADHDRRCGLRRGRHIWRRHSDSRVGSDRKRGAPLYPVQLDGALLANTCVADYRAQPPFRRFWSNLRTGHRLSGLRFHPWRGQRHDRQHSQAERLCHVMVRQEPQHAVFPVQLSRPLRPMAVRDGFRLFLRLHGRRLEPVAALSVPGSHPDFPVGWKA